MKTLHSKKLSILLAAGVALVGITAQSGASEASALRKASGVYNGTCRGSLVAVIVEGAATVPATLRTPRGKGAGSIRVDARSVGGKVYTLPVSFTKATVNGAETKVTYEGRVTVPASLTGGLGAFSGGFTATAFIKGKTTLTAKSVFSAGPATLRVTFNGAK